MAWIAVDEDGEGYIYETKPHRLEYEWRTDAQEGTWMIFARISDIAIRLLMSRDLTWEDEPIEIKAV